MSPIITLALALAQSAQTSSNPIVVGDCSFGEVYQFNTAHCAILLTNASDSSVTAAITPQVPGDKAEPTEVAIEPHSSATVITTVRVENALGEMAHPFRVHVNGASGRDLSGQAKGFAMSALDVARSSVDFGSVDLSKQTPDVKTVTLDSHDGHWSGATTILDAPAGIDASIGTDRRSVAIRMKKDADWRAMDGFVKVALDSDRQSEAWIGVKAEIHGAVSTVSNPVWMGVVPPNVERKITIPLRSSDEHDFKISRVELRDIDGEAHVTACDPVAKGCKAVAIQVSNKQKPGTLMGDVAITLPEYSKELVVSIWGVLQGPPPDAERMTAAKSAQPRVDPMAAPPAKQIEAPPGSASFVGGPHRGPVLKWQVADDIGVHGYQVFRSTSESGPFMLITVPSIPADSAKPKGVNAYEWRDESAKSGMTYWYYIGAVGKDGTKRKLSEPHKKAVTD